MHTATQDIKNVYADQTPVWLLMEGEVTLLASFTSLALTAVVPSFSFKFSTIVVFTV